MWSNTGRICRQKKCGAREKASQGLLSEKLEKLIAIYGDVEFWREERTGRGRREFGFELVKFSIEWRYGVRHLVYES